MGLYKSQRNATHGNPNLLTFTQMQATWDDIMAQMIWFINDTNADVDMAYDWVCDQLEIDSFVDNTRAWNSFYDAWESADNRNDMLLALC